MQVSATFDYCCVAPLGRFKATVWFIHSANVNSDHELDVLDLLVQGPKFAPDCAHTEEGAILQFVAAPQVRTSGAA